MKNIQLVRPLFWVGSSKRDLMALPETVVRVFGYALYLAQTGTGVCPARIPEKIHARGRDAQ